MKGIVYMAHIAHEYSPSNRLQTAVKNYLKSINRLCFFDSDLETTKAEIVSAIQQLNAEYSRCQPIPVEWQKAKWRDKDDFLLYLGQNTPICIFYLIKGIGFKTVEGPSDLLLLARGSASQFDLY